MKRFIAVRHNEVWRVSDTQWSNLPQQEDMPVRLYFKSSVNADKVAEIMNKEWEAFLRNPE